MRRATSTKTFRPWCWPYQRHWPCRWHTSHPGWRRHCAQCVTAAGGCCCWGLTGRSDCLDTASFRAARSSGWRPCTASRGARRTCRSAGSSKPTSGGRRSTSMSMQKLRPSCCSKTFARMRAARSAPIFYVPTSGATLASRRRPHSIGMRIVCGTTRCGWACAATVSWPARFTWFTAAALPWRAGWARP